MKTQNHLLILLTLLVAVSASAQTSSKLLPFQGRLTDQNGVVVADGAKVVQFKIYNAPVGGQAVWNGEVQKLSVNGGLVSTMLGSKASLGNVDFNLNLYLELTVDANNDGQITLADPPLLPRQTILPAVFTMEAANSRSLNGYDWASIFGVNDPSGPIPGAKLQPGGITSVQLAPDSVTRAKVAPGVLPAITGWQSVSVSAASTQGGTSIGVVAKARRVGENAEFMANVSFASDVTDQVLSGLQLDIPYQIAGDKLPAPDRNLVGEWYFQYGGGDQVSGVCVATGGGAIVAVKVPSYALRPGMRFDTLAKLSVRFAIPVAGWTVVE